MAAVFVPYDLIDKAKWDQCIIKACNSRIYASSMYLDHMSAHWDGIVLDDYLAVMPLTWKRKWSIKYLYQPAFIQQGGIFSLHTPDDDVILQFMTIMMNHFKFAEITLNTGNEIGPTSMVAITNRTNYLLDLHNSYEVSAGNYNDSCKKSVRRTRKFALFYEVSDDFAGIIDWYKILYTHALPYFKNIDYENFKGLCTRLHKAGSIVTRIVRNVSGARLAALVAIIANGRIYNLISCIDKEGKRLEANYFLYDKLIEEFSGSDHILDFEGSDVPGIASFYKKFNPAVEQYPYIRYNHLNPLLKVFKPA